MKPTSRSFVSNVRVAVQDDRLHAAVVNATGRFVTGRRRAADAFPDFEGLRDRAAAIKDHSLAHLDHYLERFEGKVIENGGAVHWARDGAERVTWLLLGASDTEEERALISALGRQTYSVVLFSLCDRRF